MAGTLRPAMATGLSIPNLEGRAFGMVGLELLVWASLSIPLARWLGKPAASRGGRRTGGQEELI